ncbi:MAG: ROK family protein [Bacteroidota bacterium]
MGFLRAKTYGQDKETRKKGKKHKQFRRIISCLAKSAEGLTIPEVATIVKSSVPTVTKWINELLVEGSVLECGKKETDNGRRPTIYQINPERFYTIGVEVLRKWIHVSVVRVDLETVYEASNRSFVLEDSLDCLAYVTQFIEDAIAASPVDKDQIIGVGIALAGSVDSRERRSADYFRELTISLGDWLEERLTLPVIIDNDTRALSISEQALGVAKGVDHALVVKVSRNLGMSIISDRQLVLGARGFAGNFGHLQLGGGNRLCCCGKRGCLRTQVAGNALLEDLKEALQRDESSVNFKVENVAQYSYHDVLDAVLRGDALSIDLLIRQGEILGRALGNVVNLLNPNLIVISGEYVMVKDFFLDAVKSGMCKTGLVGSLANCTVVASNLGRFFSSRGAACMILKEHELINY